MSGGYSVDAFGVVLLSDRVAGPMTDVETAVLAAQAARADIDAALSAFSEVKASFGGVVTPREESARGLMGLARQALEALHAGALAVVQADQDMATATRTAERNIGDTGKYDSRRFGQRAV